MGDNNARAELFDLRKKKSMSLETGNSQPSSVFYPDGKALATGGRSGSRASLWDVATGRLRLTLEMGMGGGRRRRSAPTARCSPSATAPPGAAVRGSNGPTAPGS